MVLFSLEEKRHFLPKDFSFNSSLFHIKPVLRDVGITISTCPNLNMDIDGDSNETITAEKVLQISKIFRCSTSFISEIIFPISLFLHQGTSSLMQSSYVLVN